MNLRLSNGFLVVFLVLGTSFASAQTKASLGLSVTGSDRSVYCFSCQNQLEWDLGVVYV